MSEESRVAPPGWYPDPSGEPQWRVWNGMRWTDVTRSFGPAPLAIHGVADLEIHRSLQRLSRYGIVATFAPFGLLDAILNPLHSPRDVVAVLVGMAVGLFAIGWAAYTVAARQLRGYWYVADVLPLANVVSFTTLLVRRVANTRPRTGMLALWLGLAVALGLTGSYLLVWPVAMVAADQWRLVDATLHLGDLA